MLTVGVHVKKNRDGLGEGGQNLEILSEHTFWMPPNSFFHLNLPWNKVLLLCENFLCEKWLWFTEQLLYSWIHTCFSSKWPFFGQKNILTQSKHDFLIKIIFLWKLITCFCYFWKKVLIFGVAPANSIFSQIRLKNSNF